MLGSFLLIMKHQHPQCVFHQGYDLALLFTSMLNTRKARGIATRDKWMYPWSYKNLYKMKCQTFVQNELPKHIQIKN